MNSPCSHCILLVSLESCVPVLVFPRRVTRYLSLLFSVLPHAFPSTYSTFIWHPCLWKFSVRFLAKSSKLLPPFYPREGSKSLNFSPSEKIVLAAAFFGPTTCDLFSIPHSSERSECIPKSMPFHLLFRSLRREWLSRRQSRSSLFGPTPFSPKRPPFFPRGDKTAANFSNATYTLQRLTVHSPPLRAFLRLCFIGLFTSPLFAPVPRCV